MKKLIAVTNMTVDGFCDHTAIAPDEEIHQHYADLLRTAGTVLYGRITYQLMEYWRTVVENPTGNQAMDDFAKIMDEVPKVVFSNTLKELTWKSARLADRGLKEEVLALKQSSHDGAKDMMVGSPGLIVATTALGLIDEYQICVHPVVVGNGLPLFKNIEEKVSLKLLSTKTFSSGAILLCYRRA
ncbi:MAG TPA: dihydrofolate reductase family protein [Cyclobacteriaceae bacterium]|nr:dihydrofolate reductase family protein [Cyclobacteriaceae bacterium]